MMIISLAKLLPEVGFFLFTKIIYHHHLSIIKDFIIWGSQGRDTGWEGGIFQNPNHSTLVLYHTEKLH